MNYESCTTTICVNCRFIIRNLSEDWFKYECAAVEREPAINPVTGVTNRYEFCLNINHGNCEYYQEN